MARFNILCLSGGGFFGLYTISVLEALEEVAGAPLAKRFDLIAGTSVGGIIGLGLAAEVPAKTIKEHFEKRGAQIFSGRSAPKTALGSFFDVLRSVCKPKYQATALRETISDIVGADLRIGELEHRVIVPAVNLTKGLPQIFKTGHHPTFTRDPKRRVVDVALATSAAPTFFPLAEVGDALFADGGLYANSPDLLAVHEAEYFLEKPISDIHVLSIGTTTSHFSFAHEDGANFGIYHWSKGQRLVNVIIASQQHSVNYMMGHRLGERYVRLDVDQSKEQERHLALDVATETAQRTIRGLAEATVQANINKPNIRAFLNHVVAKPHFFMRAD